MYVSSCHWNVRLWVNILRDRIKQILFETMQIS